MNERYRLPPIDRKAAAVPSLFSEEQFDAHYSKHHRTYIDKTNKSVEEGEFSHSSMLEYLASTTSGATFNQVAQAWNHTFFWFSLGLMRFPKTASDAPPAPIKAKAAELREEGIDAAASHFGSGWVWLVTNDEGKLRVVTTPNGETPLPSGERPLLVMDVWEHAYYLDYQSEKKAYAEKCWEHLNWEWAEALNRDPQLLAHVETTMCQDAACRTSPSQPRREHEQGNR